MVQSHMVKCKILFYSTMSLSNSKLLLCPLFQLWPNNFGKNVFIPNVSGPEIQRPKCLWPRCETAYLDTTYSYETSITNDY